MTAFFDPPVAHHAGPPLPDPEHVRPSRFLLYHTTKLDSQATPINPMT